MGLSFPEYEKAINYYSLIFHTLNFAAVPGAPHFGNYK